MILSILRKLLYLHFFLAIGPVLKAEKISYAPHNFTLAAGYSLEKVAAPPLVQRPIHMSFDENGVLYVTDSSGNTDNAPAQLKDPSHRIMRLVDEDGDGTFDASTLFADKVPFPEGILVHDGSVYVGFRIILIFQIDNLTWCYSYSAYPSC